VRGGARTPVLGKLPMDRRARRLWVWEGTRRRVQLGRQRRLGAHYLIHRHHPVRRISQQGKKIFLSNFTGVALTLKQGDILRDFFTISVLTPNSIRGGSLGIAPTSLGGWHRRRIVEDMRKVTVLLRWVWAAPGLEIPAWLR
jgi:hypothetical protein